MHKNVFHAAATIFKTEERAKQKPTEVGDDNLFTTF
jgi:hypothetical protein